MKRIRLAAPMVSALLVSSLALAACGTNPGGSGSAGTAPATSSAPADALRIGLALPTTGSQASFGGDQVIAAQMAIDSINEAGGVNGRQLQLISLDTKADPTVAINAVTRLVEVDKVPAFVTAFTSVVKAVAPIANEAGVVELSMGATSPEIAKLGEYVFTGYPLADVDLTALARYTVETSRMSSASIMYINNDAGKEGSAIYGAAFEKAGGRVLAREAYEPAATSYSGQIQKIKAAGAEVIFLHGLVEDIPQVIAQLRQQGVTTPITSFSPANNPKVIEQLGDAAEGLVVTDLTPSKDENPKIGEYLARWDKEQKRQPNGLPYTMYVHDSVYLLSEVYKWALDNDKPITGKSVVEGIEAIGTFSLPLTGEITFNEDRTVRKPVTILEVRDGAFARVATIS